MALTTSDQIFINAIIAAMNAYATTMVTFTAGAAGTAQTNLANALTAATASWYASLKNEGE